MKTKGPLYGLVLAIAAITAATGAVQAVAPGYILRLIGAETTATSKHFFGIVGMFMVLFGGMLLEALLSSSHHPIAVLWAGLQKLGASAAVGLGVSRGIFSSLALLVAAFDLVSGLLVIRYWVSVRRS